MLKLLLILLAACYVAAHEDFWTDTYQDEEQVDDEKQRLKALQIQCTRRYSPGRCLDEVKPVWTYSFHLQNCTPRLGCRQQTIVNRFLSYQTCMESCQSLVKIYNHILSQGSSDNDTEKWQQHGNQSMRRSGDALEEFTIDIQPEEEEAPKRYHSHDLFFTSLLEEREDPDRIRLAEVLPPNIDYQADEIAHYDPLHPKRRVVYKGF